MNAVAPVRMVDIRDSNGARTDNLLHQLREDADGLWMFIAHSGELYNKDIPWQQDVQIILQGEYHVRLYDTQSGEILPIRHESRDGMTIVHAALYDYDSLLLRFDQADAGQPAEATDKKYRRLPVPELADYTLHEPNVLLLDKAEFALDDGAYHPAQELLRADNALRAELGWSSRQGAVVQPWTVPEEIVEHYARLRFTIHADCNVAGAKLALEDASLASVTLNGEPVPVQLDGWFVDKCIQALPLPELRAGVNLLEVILPITHRDGLEWCYLLGDFGVEIMGSQRVLTTRRETLGFSDWVYQRLPHYTGNVTYRIPVRTQGGKLRVTAPHYRGAAIRVALDGEDKGYIVYAPYQLEMAAPAGEHELQLTILGHRENAFGPLHNADAQAKWIGPDIWRTTGNVWTESYRLVPMGLLSAPLVEEET